MFVAICIRSSKRRMKVQKVPDRKLEYSMETQLRIYSIESVLRNLQLCFFSQ